VPNNIKFYSYNLTATAKEAYMKLTRSLAGPVNKGIYALVKVATYNATAVSYARKLFITFAQRNYNLAI
jgi:hypothetical protein